MDGVWSQGRIRFGQIIIGRSEGDSGESAVLSLLAEIAHRCGAGNGTVDLPVAREKSTDYPVIVGLSLKGSLQDRAEQL